MKNYNKVLVNDRNWFRPKVSAEFRDRFRPNFGIGAFTEIIIILWKNNYRVINKDSTYTIFIVFQLVNHDMQYHCTNMSLCIVFINYLQACTWFLLSKMSRNRSPLWKFFSISAVAKKFVACKSCNVNISRGSEDPKKQTTSEMKTHTMSLSCKWWPKYRNSVSVFRWEIVVSAEIRFR